MDKIFINILIFFAISFHINAQDTLKTKVKIDTQILINGSLSEQFDFIFNNSVNYKGVHVIKDEWFNKYQSHVIDSVNKLKTELTIEKQKLTTISNENNALTSEIAHNEDIINQINNISFLGIRLDKDAYQGILWSIIIVLGVAMSYFIYKYKNSHVLTKNAILRFEELETELNESRSKSLEREQALNRKLFDEQKKNSK